MATTLTLDQDENDRIDRLVTEAWSRVAEGYEAALAIPGLPPVEAEPLRASLRACRQITQQPRLYRVSGT